MWSWQNISFHKKQRYGAQQKKFGVSKSTVHKDITERLRKVNPQLYKQVAEILQINKEERHIRGGMATKRKYESHRER